MTTPSATGSAPPERPVPAPRATNGTWCSWQSRTTACTSAAERGQHDEVGDGAMARERVALVGAELLRARRSARRRGAPARRQRETRGKAPPPDDSRAPRGGQAEGASSASTAVESSVCPVASRTVALPSGSIGSIAIPWRRSATTWLTRPIPSFSHLARLERVGPRLLERLRCRAEPAELVGARRDPAFERRSAWSTSRSPTGSGLPPSRRSRRRGRCRRARAASCAATG